jgi:hypothetical protein
MPTLIEPANPRAAFVPRTSDFGFPSAFGFRLSGLRVGAQGLAPDLRTALVL